MAEYHGAPEARQIPGSEPEVVERQRVAKECSAERARCWTVQNQVRDVLGRVSQALQEEFSILPILKRYELNKRLCSLQRRRERTQRA